MDNKTKQNKNKKKSNKKQLAALILLFVVGLSILMYPTVANLWNQYKAHQMIGDYGKAVAKGDPAEYEELFEKAKEYNKKLGKEAVPDAFAVREGTEDKEYEAMLDITGDGIMGVIEIPAIGVELPVYHYTTKEVLEKGAGHLLGSSLPVGGKGSHSVISAHRGLPSMKLFTDLNLLKEGDKFFYTVLNKHFAYEIDQIRTVRPRNTKDLAIDKGKDLSTLVTCTPYGVNSHRLLVRGHRVPYVPEDKNVSNRSSWIRDLPLWAVIVAAIIGLLIGITIVRMINAKRAKKKAGSEGGADALNGVPAGMNQKEMDAYKASGELGANKASDYLNPNKTADEATRHEAGRPIDNGEQ